MIVELLLQLIYNILNLLLIFNIPSLPTQAEEYITMFFGYLETGASILSNYTPLPYLMTLFGVILAIDVGIQLYHFIMWILRKIPMLSVS